VNFFLFWALPISNNRFPRAWHWVIQRMTHSEVSSVVNSLICTCNLHRPISPLFSMLAEFWLLISIIVILNLGKWSARNCQDDSLLVVVSGGFYSTVHQTHDMANKWVIMRIDHVYGPIKLYKMNKYFSVSWKYFWEYMFEYYISICISFQLQSALSLVNLCCRLKKVDRIMARQERSGSDSNFFSTRAQLICYQPLLC
jgi:hypothetical protein